MKKLKTPTQYSKLYDIIYGEFAKQRNYKPTDEYKSIAMDNIFTSIPLNEKTAVEILASKKHTYDHAAKLAKMDKRILLKSYDLGMKHMKSPNNIAIAVKGYYDVVIQTPFKKEDFGGKTYILTALNKSGLYYREQLYRHLDNGWYYLWTIPGIGDGARQILLRKLEYWNYSHNVIKNNNKEAT